MFSLNAEIMLLAFLLFIGYVYIIRHVCFRMDRSNTLIVSFVIFALYFVMGIILIKILQNMDLLFVFLLLLLFIMTGITVAMAAVYIRDYPKHINKTAVIAFIIYSAAVLYIAFFGRTGIINNSINVEPLAFIFKPINDVKTDIRHFLLNIVMMIPVGFLFSLSRKGYTSIYYTFPCGMMFSVFIETIQYSFKRGKCDIDDIIANTLGVFIGFIIYNIAVNNIFSERK